MSIWTTIGNILALVPKAIAAISGISRAARTGPPVRQDPWARPHHWTIDDLDAPLPWTYSCQYCKAPRYSAKAAMPCAGPKS
jgi:hypothetical protein